MGDDTGAAKELWEGLGDKDKDESEGKGEDTGGDLVSTILS